MSVSMMNKINTVIFPSGIKKRTLERGLSIW